MKKICSLLVVVTLILSCVVTSFAQSNTIRIDELGISALIPNSYQIINKETPANDSIFKEFNTTKNEILSYFDSKNIVFNCVSKDKKDEIVVTKTESNLSDFHSLNDAVLEMLASGIAGQKYEIYHNSQTKFIKAYFYDKTDSVYGVQYFTVIDKKAINFILRSSDKQLSSNQEAIMKSFIDSVKYDSYDTHTAASENSNSFFYEDNNSGVCFTVPTNWKKTPLSKQRETIDVKFTSTKEKGLLILFGATDIWKKIPDSEKAGKYRENYDETMFLKSDIAEAFGLKSNKISEKSYNNIHFYIFEKTTPINMYNTDFSINMTYAIHIQNGWMYMFQFGATKSNQHFIDFEEMLNTVYIKDDTLLTENVGGVNSGNYNIKRTLNYLALARPLGLIITLLIIAMFIIIKQKASKKVYNEENHSMGLENYNEHVFCEKCGADVTRDNGVCHVCGSGLSSDFDKNN